jgi:hypothetical protein
LAGTSGAADVADDGSEVGSGSWVGAGVTEDDSTVVDEGAGVVTFLTSTTVGSAVVDEDAGVVVTSLTSATVGSDVGAATVDEGSSDEVGKGA